MAAVGHRDVDVAGAGADRCPGGVHLAQCAIEAQDAAATESNFAIDRPRVQNGTGQALRRATSGGAHREGGCGSRCCGSGHHRVSAHDQLAVGIHQAVVFIDKITCGHFVNQCRRIDGVARSVGFAAFNVHQGLALEHAADVCQPGGIHHHLPARLQGLDKAVDAKVAGAVQADGPALRAIQAFGLDAAVVVHHQAQASRVVTCTAVKADVSG